MSTPSHTSTASSTSSPSLTKSLATSVARGHTLKPQLWSKKIIFSFIVLLMLSVIVAVGSIFVGSVRLNIHEVILALTGQIPGSDTQLIVRELRLPRIIIGFSVGMMLASSGALLQGLFRNPLVDPGLIGVSSGAGLAASVILILFPSWIEILPFAAFVGALSSTLIIYGLSLLKGGSPVNIILAGLAVNILIGAVLTTLNVIYSDRVQLTVTWFAGRLSGISWSSWWMIAPYMIVGLMLTILAIRPLKIMMLGDELSTSLGFPVRLARFFIIALASLLAGTAVSVAGLLGFVGLIIPHMVRLTISSDYRWVLPFSMLLGGIFVVLSDTFARSLFSFMELPVGVILSALGGPYFLYLFMRGKGTLNV